MPDHDSWRVIDHGQLILGTAEQVEKHSGRGLVIDVVIGRVHRHDITELAGSYVRRVLDRLQIDRCAAAVGLELNDDQAARTLLDSDDPKHVQAF